MQVICKKDTKILIKGNTYEVLTLNSSRGRLTLKNIKGIYSVNNFTDTNGNQLPKIDITNKITENILKPWKVKISDLKIGELLLCTSDRYATYNKDALYQIEDLKYVPKKRTYLKNTITYNKEYIKFVGIERYILFSGWRFRKLTKEETRDISLKSVLHNEHPNIKKNKDNRKLDSSKNKNLDIISNLCYSILDKNRHKLSIVDWSCRKPNNNLGIKKSDYDIFLNMKLKDILELIEQNK